MEGFVVCPGDDLFNSLFMLWTELTKCIVPRICEVAFQGYIRASRAMMSFDAVKHLFGNFNEVASCPGNWQKCAWREQVKRRTSALFIYLTWTIISMRDIKQHMLLNPLRFSVTAHPSIFLSSLPKWKDCWKSHLVGISPSYRPSVAFYNWTHFSIVMRLL